MSSTKMSVNASAPTERRLITVSEVAEKYGCDERSVYRWADTGLIPFGIKLGALRRWDVTVIDAHIAAGCPRERSAKSASRSTARLRKGQ